MTSAVHDSDRQDFRKVTGTSNVVPRVYLPIRSSPARRRTYRPPNAASMVSVPSDTVP